MEGWMVEREGGGGMTMERYLMTEDGLFIVQYEHRLIRY